MADSAEKTTVLEERVKEKAKTVLEERGRVEEKERGARVEEKERGAVLEERGREEEEETTVREEKGRVEEKEMVTIGALSKRMPKARDAQWRQAKMKSANVQLGGYTHARRGVLHSQDMKWEKGVSLIPLLRMGPVGIQMGRNAHSHGKNTGNGARKFGKMAQTS